MQVIHHNLAIVCSFSSIEHHLRFGMLRGNNQSVNGMIPDATGHLVAS